MKVTLKDIAKRVGCSVPVVSQVMRPELNGNVRFSPDLASEVRRVANDLGYHVSRRNSALPKTITVIDLELDFVHVFPHSFHDAINKNLGDHGLNVNYLEYNKSDYETRIKKLISGRESAGLICFNHFDPKTIELAKKHSLPYVIVNAGPANSVNCVYPDDAGGVREAVKLLKLCLYKKIVYLYPGESKHVSFKTRLETLEELCGQSGIEIVAIINRDELPDKKQLQAFKDKGVDAFVGYGMGAAAIINRIFMSGYSVPEDFGFLALGGVEGWNLEPLPTHVNIPIRETARVAVERLLCMLNGERASCDNVALPEHVVIGETCAMAR